ncbi:Rne/Rng family ribonuclease [Thiovibrio frasassiensis]|uniref:Ribonuclease G n=1 Tax=Thiovibrio frasassiensis TaxID=2984131 RepID=A0A9X4ME38_9BACT|nr:Rne/Rng family ribonuclease [Thiovibrio frasassiensis]MDG4475874.1 Rne/Rng family ribonuclease [Thiovibrio frasassiensis]
MTNDTTKPADERPNGQGPENNGEERSILSRVSKWLKKPGRPGEEEGQAAGQASPAAAPASGQSAPAPSSGETSRAEGDTTSPTGSKPRRRKRPPRRRSKTPRPEGQQAAPGGEGEHAAPAAPHEAEAVKEKPATPARQPRQRPPRKAAARSTEAPKATESRPPAKGNTTLKLLINTDEPEECRLVLLENGKVESFYVETVSQAQTKGNIYKGRVTAVEANLQAAFVDYGTEKNGFLPFGDIHPEYYANEVAADTHWKDLPIQDVLSKGQEVLVEVVKEATGNKGATLTTYLSLPGRYLVLMPGSDSAGISRKIESEEERNKLREMVDSVSIPEGIGYIVRTASQEITKTALAQDVRYLLNLWKEIKKQGQTLKAPALLHKEQNIVSRFLRDHFTSEIEEILVDDEEALAQVNNFLELLPAAQRKSTVAKLHKGIQPLFHQYHVEKQIEQIYQPTVPLHSGGSIVINPTEALVAIDVNSGRTGKDKSFEDAIFLANMEAAEELSRQLRLRDLGGLIVVDFIDMRDSKHIREVEKKVRDSMKRDKAKVDFSKISKFGLMQISRQKMAAPVAVGSYRICPHCQGRGMVRSVETQALVHFRHIQTGVTRKDVKRVVCRLPMEVAQYILNKKRADLIELEQENQVEISIIPEANMPPTESKIDFLKE